MKGVTKQLLSNLDNDCNEISTLSIVLSVSIAMISLA